MSVWGRWVAEKAVVSISAQLLPSNFKRSNASR